MKNLTLLLCTFLLTSCISINGSNKNQNLPNHNLNAGPAKEKISVSFEEQTLTINIKDVAAGVDFNTPITIGSSDNNICSLKNVSISFVNLLEEWMNNTCSDEQFLCSAKKGYTEKSLTELGNAFGLYAIRIDDNSCDSLYFYWDNVSQSYTLHKMN